MGVGSGISFLQGKVTIALNERNVIIKKLYQSYQNSSWKVDPTMGTYHPNPDWVAAGIIGRRLEVSPFGIYRLYLAQLQGTEKLWLHTTIGSRHIVILLDTESEFDYVMGNQQGKGPYTFYAIEGY